MKNTTHHNYAEDIIRTVVAQVEASHIKDVISETLTRSTMLRTNTIHNMLQDAINILYNSLEDAPQYRKDRIQNLIKRYEEFNEGKTQ